MIWTYYGNVSIWAYLQLVCASFNVPGSSVMLILVEDFHWTNMTQHHSSQSPPTTTTASAIHNHLQSLDCYYFHLTNVTPSQLASTLVNITNQFASGKPLTLIDFSAHNWIAHQTEMFRSYLSTMEQLYNDCVTCLPMITMFDVPVEQLYRWTVRDAQTHTNTLQSVMLSTIDQQSTNRSSVIHIRPVLDGCRVGDPIVFRPVTSVDFERLRTSYKKCDLNATILNVAVNEMLPFCKFSRTPDKQLLLYESIEKEFLQVLMSKLNFRVNFVDSKQTWGSLTNGTWDGSVGKVMKRSVDLGICAISQNIARLEVVDFTHFIILDEMAFITTAPKIKTRDWLVLEPFSWIVWLAVLVSFLAVTTIIVQLTMIGGNIEHQTSLCSYWACIALRLYATLVNQSTNMFTERVHVARLTYASWTMAAFVLAYSYTGCFYSFLAVVQYESAIDTIDDLARVITQDNSYRIVTHLKSSYYHEFVSAKPEKGIYYLIGQSINKTRQVTLNTRTEILLEIENQPNTIVILPRFFLRFKQQNMSNLALHIGSQGIGLDMVSWMLPKRSPLLKPFDMMIVRIHQMGLLKYWIKKTFANLTNGLQMDEVDQLYDDPVTLDSNLATKVLGLKDIRSIYILWSIGIVCSTVIFIIELITNVSH